MFVVIVRVYIHIHTHACEIMILAIYFDSHFLGENGQMAISKNNPAFCPTSQTN